MLTIRTFYAGDGTGSAEPATLTVRLRDGGGDQAFGVWLRPEAPDVRHELPDRADATIATDVATLLGVLGESDRLPGVDRRRMAIDGDPEVVRRLVAGVAVPGARPW
jgi:hypothetical protein